MSYRAYPDDFINLTSGGLDNAVKEYERLVEMGKRYASEIFDPFSAMKFASVARNYTEPKKGSIDVKFDLGQTLGFGIVGLSIVLAGLAIGLSLFLTRRK